jgi:hypothetical protein
MSGKNEFIKYSRLIRNDVIAEILKHIPTMEVDLSAIAEQHRIGFASGYREALRQIDELLRDMEENQSTD